MTSNAYAQTRKHGRKWRAVCARILANAHHCVYCGIAIDTALPVGHARKATVDHVQPLASGGQALAPDNLVPCCHRCNSSKGARDVDQWRTTSGYRYTDTLRIN